MAERDRHIYIKGRIAFTFGKNGKGLSDEFNIINQLTNLFSKDNYITIHKAFIHQVDDIYDLVFDIQPKEDVEYIMKNEEELES